VKCYSCEKKLKRNEVYFGDLGTPLEGKPLCEDCYYDDEICAIVYYGRDEEPYLITEARNETNGDFRVKWHSTDPWRGYFETSSEKYSLVNTAELLAGHESEKMLKQFDERIRELFDEHGIDYARVFARSSNVFYQNYDLYVRKDQKNMADLLVAKAKSEVDYDNPKWYRNIIFDELTFRKLVKLFPEYKIETDYDLFRLLEKHQSSFLKELRDRLRKLNESNL